MKAIYTTSIFLLLICSSCVNRRPVSDPKIAGGLAVLPDSVEAHATVALMSIRNKPHPSCLNLDTSLSELIRTGCLEVTCSGTVVSQRAVISAAHCATGTLGVTNVSDITRLRTNRERTLDPADRMFIRVGTNAEESTVVEVAAIAIRSELPRILARNEIEANDLDSDYFSEWAVNPIKDPVAARLWAVRRDLALVSAMTDLPKNAVAVPILSDAPEVGSDLLSAGFGTDKLGIPPPSGDILGEVSFPGQAGRLNSMSVKVQSIASCESPVFDVKAPVDAAVCPGDSGGPVYAKGASKLGLTGVISNGTCVAGNPNNGTATMVLAAAHSIWLKAAAAALGVTFDVSEGGLSSCAPLPFDNHDQGF
jgi:hypothetical protein